LKEKKNVRAAENTYRIVGKAKGAASCFSAQCETEGNKRQGENINFLFLAVDQGLKGVAMKLIARDTLPRTKLSKTFLVQGKLKKNSIYSTLTRTTIKNRPFKIKIQLRSFISAKSIFQATQSIS